MKNILSLLTVLILKAPLLADELQTTLPLANEQGFTQTLTMVSVGLFFFYFILFRPEQKRRKQLESQRNAMKKGDQVNVMGIIGHISQIKEQTAIIRMVDGAKIEVLKAAITEVIPSKEESKENQIKEG